jgi:hypothetical protein
MEIRHILVSNLFNHKSSRQIFVYSENKVDIWFKLTSFAFLRNSIFNKSNNFTSLMQQILKFQNLISILKHTNSAHTFQSCIWRHILILCLPSIPWSSNCSLKIACISKFSTVNVLFLTNHEYKCCYIFVLSYISYITYLFI